VDDTSAALTVPPWCSLFLRICLEEPENGITISSHFPHIVPTVRGIERRLT
jgi:hypothetical protein